MIDTLIALVFAHFLGDYAFQTRWMVDNKRNPLVLLLHVVIHFVCIVAALGGAVEMALLITAVHLVIDALKTYGFPPTLTAYLTDQAAHLVTILLVAIYVPDLFAQGVWGPSAALFREPMILMSGFLACVLAGGPAVGLLLQNYTNPDIEAGLARGGWVIGNLERALIFLMVLTNQLAGIGFLIAAKSILRFDTASKDQKNSEYVIIGTLASFGWALLIAFATQSARAATAP